MAGESKHEIHRVSSSLMGRGRVSMLGRLPCARGWRIYLFFFFFFFFSSFFFPFCQCFLWGGDMTCDTILRHFKLRYLCPSTEYLSTLLLSKVLLRPSHP